MRVHWELRQTGPKMHHQFLNLVSTIPRKVKREERERTRMGMAFSSLASSSTSPFQTYSYVGSGWRTKNHDPLPFAFASESA